MGLEWCTIWSSFRTRLFPDSSSTNLEQTLSIGGLTQSEPKVSMCVSKLAKAPGASFRGVLNELTRF